jgi:hypothetical protein
MLASAILGGTIFDDLQVICELLLWIFLVMGVLQLKFSQQDLLLLFAFGATSAISLLLNKFEVFALDFKIFGLCIFAFVYFRHVHFNPRGFIAALLVLNAILVSYQFITGQSIIPTSYFGYYKTYAEDRPVGLFLIPHATCFFVAICILREVATVHRYARAFVMFVFAMLTQSLTAILALLAQLGMYVLQQSRLARKVLGPVALILVVVVPITLLYVFGSDLLDASKSTSSYTRYYSLAILLEQLYDPTYYMGLLTPYPGDYQSYVELQEATLAAVGNEIGLIKVFVEGGIVLGALTLVLIMRELKYFRVFILVSLLHYSFVVNMPFMLYLMLTYNREIEVARRRRLAPRVDDGALLTSAAKF